MATVGEDITLPAPPAVQPDVLYEIVNGEYREVPPMGAFAGAVASLLLHHLNSFSLPKSLGAAVCEVLFRLGPGRPSLRPDLAFVEKSRWPFTAATTDDPPALDVVPNLAVEVVSPTNLAPDVIDKIQDYFAAGVQLVWVLYPRQRQVYVYESPTQIRILTAQDELDGGAVLPGFKLGVGTLFAPPV
jgi:Uma2 family endonuclease